MTPRFAVALAIALLGSIGVAQAGYRELYSFSGGTDGSRPSGGPVVGAHGALYGVTGDGGTGGDCAAHCGTIYRVGRDGTETVLHRFTGADGLYPLGELLPDASGNLYGVTMGGGISCWRTLDGCGTVFKLAPDGTFTTLYKFKGGEDGAAPSGGLIADAQGNLYGVTEYGGFGAHQFGFGTVYKLAPDGTESVLYFFDDDASEQYPYGRMAVDDGGALYGLAEGGGFWGQGTLFKLVPGHSFSAVHIFDSRTKDGTDPVGFTRLPDGTFYGATSTGGANGLGAVFKVAPDGTESLLHSFAGGTTDGRSPVGGVALDGAGNVYGVTALGGDCRAAQGCGVAYRIAPDGTETILHNFRKRSGTAPVGTLAVDARGRLHGAAMQGGASNLGTVYLLVP